MIVTENDKKKCKFLVYESILQPTFKFSDPQEFLLKPRQIIWKDIG